jgi:putative hydrolase
MFVVPRQMYGIRLLMGCEVNILDTKGSLDLNDDYLDRLDIAIAGIHGNCWKGGDKNQNTEGMLTVINNPKIHVISHPGDGTAEMDFEQLVIASKETHTLLEINNHSLASQRKKTVAITNSLEILRLCKKHDVPLILSSDAHISFQIADYSRIIPLVEEVGFPDELIINYWPEQFFKYLGINTKPQ